MAKYETSNIFQMVDAYIYLYHLKKFVVLPIYPDNVSDNISVTYASTTPLSRSAPILSYSNSGPRTVSVQLLLHREMMNQVNTGVSNFISSSELVDFSKKDYIDTLIGHLQAMALPEYITSSRMVNPPMIAMRIGEQLYIKGVIQGGINVGYNLPVLANGKYAVANIGFTITEVEPFDASTVAKQGSKRGVSTTLDRKVWKGLK